MFDIVASYHRTEFKGKLMIQTQENGKKPHFGSDLSNVIVDVIRTYFRLFFFLREIFTTTKTHTSKQK